MILRRAAGVLFVIGLVAIAAPIVIHAQTLGSYDTFAGPEIDPVRWRGQETVFNATLGPRNTEVTRRIIGGKLETALRTFGSAVTDTGITGSANSRVLINHPALTDGDPAITAIQAGITPKAAVSEDCAANTSQGTSRARVFGLFFNDGTANTTPGDLTGDILAGVNLERNSKLGDRIVAFVARCDEPACQQPDTIKSVAFSRAWQVNTAELVTVRWRKATKDFQFTIASALGNENHVLTYGDLDILDRERPKALIAMQLGVNNNVVNCTDGRKQAFFDALFDNVKLNSNAITALP